MARRTVCTLTAAENHQVWARIVWDSEWQEYIATFRHVAQLAGGDSQYHTDCLDDAKSTAQVILDNLAALVAEGKDITA